MRAVLWLSLGMRLGQAPGLRFRTTPLPRARAPCVGPQKTSSDTEPTAISPVVAPSSGRRPGAWETVAIHPLGLNLANFSFHVLPQSVNKLCALPVSLG